MPRAHSVTIVTGTMAALVGRGTILSAVTLVWMLSVRLRDASIADVWWGPGFLQLAWLYCFLSPVLSPRSWLVAALVTLGVRDSRGTSFAVTAGRARIHGTRRCAPHAASELLWRRDAVVGLVRGGGIDTRRLAHPAESVPHDAVC